MTDADASSGHGVSQKRRAKEESRIGHRPHIDGLTRGTMIEYDDWQWCVVTDVAEEEDPTMIGFIVVDKLGDDLISVLESAWGCWEHYEAVEPFRGGDHEYWTDINYLTGDDIWTVLGPLHPESRKQQEADAQ